MGRIVRGEIEQRLKYRDASVSLTSEGDNRNATTGQAIAQQLSVPPTFPGGCIGEDEFFIAAITAKK